MFIDRKCQCREGRHTRQAQTPGATQIGTISIDWQLHEQATSCQKIKTTLTKGEVMMSC